MDLDWTLAAALSIALGSVLVLALRAVAGSDGVDLGDILAPHFDLGWPRGVQEEDLIPWRIESLTPRPDRERAERRTAELAPRRSVATRAATRTGQTNI